MYIFDIAPLTTIPRPLPSVFTYYFPKQLARFSLVTIPVARKQVPGLIIASRDIKDFKLFLRKSSSFTLKEVGSVIQATSVIYDWQFELAIWIADYYWASLGAVLKKFIPDYGIDQRQTTYDLQQPSIKQDQRLFLFPDASFFKRIALPEETVKFTSALTKKKEFLLFKALSGGKSMDIAGTRSALFAPYNLLKEIHLYEEVDANHKSWDQRPKINAVSIAKKLAQLHRASLVYHSTLPSLESYRKKIDYQPLVIENKARVVALDLTKETLRAPLGAKALELIKEAYANKAQVILYVNRRGEGRFLLCRDCGFVPRCKNCDLSLTLHSWVKGRPMRTLLCHHCGYVEPPPSLCAQCGSHQIRSYGFGSERVEQELRALLPQARVFRLDSDRATNERAKQHILNEFFTVGHFLIATSMLFSSVPKAVPIVLAISPDSELNIPDYAQHEKLFFNLWRLKYWAKNALFFQTYSPSHPVYSALVSGDWQGFYREELLTRKALNYPPFSFIIKLTCAHRLEVRAAQESQIIYKTLTRITSKLPRDLVVMLGPAPAFIPRLKGKYRYTILLKIKDEADEIKKALLPAIPSSWEIDVDPVDSL